MREGRWLDRGLGQIVRGLRGERLVPSKHLHTLPDTDQKNLDAVNRHRRFGWVSQIPR